MCNTTNLKASLFHINSCTRQVAFSHFKLFWQGCLRLHTNIHIDRCYKGPIQHHHNQNIEQISSSRTVCVTHKSITQSMKWLFLLTMASFETVGLKTLFTREKWTSFSTYTVKNNTVTATVHQESQWTDISAGQIWK